MMNRILIIFSMFALTFSLAACDSEGANDDEGADGFVLDAGSFEATIDDDGEPLDIAGGAVFGLTPSPSGGEEFVMYMLDGERPPEDERSATNRAWSMVQITGRTGEVPGVDTYDFDEGGTVPDYRNDMDSYELGGFIGGGPGTFTITSASEDELEGTFSFESPDGDTEVEGSFTAVRVDDIDTVLCTPDCDE